MSASVLDQLRELEIAIGELPDAEQRVSLQNKRASIEFAVQNLMLKVDTATKEVARLKVINEVGERFFRDVDDAVRLTRGGSREHKALKAAIEDWWSSRRPLGWDE